MLLGITNFNFFLLLAICFFLYYSPLFKNRQWILLLTMSLFFYYFNAEPFGIFIPILQAFIAWMSAKSIEKHEEKNKFIHHIAVTLMIVILILFRYLPFIGTIIGWFGLKSLSASFMTTLISTIGLQYFTLSLIGYVTDVYWKQQSSESNYFKVLLFGIYFPQLTSGPLTRFSNMNEQFILDHRYDEKRTLFGIERMILGLFKKILIADNIAKYINLVNTNIDSIHPIFLILNMILFTFEIYLEFSGCMDIIMGASELFGISLPENFHSPFLSKSFTEFWRRWHMTMGAWFKDYVLYPLQKSKWFQRWSKAFRKKHGKSFRKWPSYVLLFMMWLVIGAWHGGEMRFIIASGILPWFFLVTEQMLGLDKPNGKAWLHILRTFIIYAICDIFISNPDVPSALIQIKAFFMNWTLPVQTTMNLLAENDFGKFYFGIVIFGILVSAFFDVMNDRNIDIREKLYTKNPIFTHIVLLSAVLLILVFGVYGDVNAASFIYKDF